MYRNGVYLLKHAQGDVLSLVCSNPLLIGSVLRVPTCILSIRLQVSHNHKITHSHNQTPFAVALIGDKYVLAYGSCRLMSIGTESTVLCETYVFAMLVCNIKHCQPVTFHRCSARRCHFLIVLHLLQRSRRNEQGFQTKFRSRCGLSVRFDHPTVSDSIACERNVRTHHGK